MFITNWRRVLLRAESMWAVYIATALEVATQALPYVSDYLPWWVPIAVLASTPFFRIRDQGGLDAN